MECALQCELALGCLLVKPISKTFATFLLNRHIEAPDGRMA